MESQFLSPVGVPPHLRSEGIYRVHTSVYTACFGVITGGVCILNRQNRGGRTRLPKFKFSAKFLIGLHVILQIQIKKIENDCYIMWKIILTENPSRFNVEPLLK